MSRMEEIARYHTAEELYETGMDWLNGTNGKMTLHTHAVKWLSAAADKGHPEAINMLKKLKQEGIFTEDDCI